MTWTQTYTGRPFSFLEPHHGQVVLCDIARALAGLCRFTAHTGQWCGDQWCPVHWSVAEHSMAMANMLPTPLRIHALLHDAHEAYTGDVTTPYKQAMPEHVRVWFDTMDATIEEVIYDHFGVAPPTDEQRADVKDADLRMLMTEARQFHLPPPRSWRIAAKPYDIVLRPMGVGMAMVKYGEYLSDELARGARG